MSFSFSHNLLGEISSSQGSQSDSFQPSTQSMVGYNMSTSSRQNFTLPRPPFCPNTTRNTFSSSQDQQRAKYKYSQVENTSSDKAGLGQTLREVQARLSSVPSSCSRMLEEGLVFLEEEISKEKEVTAASVKVVKDFIEKISDFCEVSNQELNEKKRASLIKSFEMVESLKELLVGVEEDQKNTLKVIDIMEERLDYQMKVNKELSRDINQLNGSSMNMSEVVKKVVKEEMEKKQRKTGQVNTGWGGARERRADVTGAVRGFSLARRLDKQVEAMVDFFTVMEVDDDEDDEVEE